MALRLGGAVGCILVAAAAGPSGSGGESQPIVPSAVRAHADPAALERAVLDATLAFLRADLASARSALDRIEEGCNRLKRDEGTPFPGEVVVYDQAFHTALDFAREYAVKGRLEESFDQFVWIQRGCRGCHATAGSLVRPRAVSGEAQGPAAGR